MGSNCCLLHIISQINYSCLPRRSFPPVITLRCLKWHILSNCCFPLFLLSSINIKETEIHVINLYNFVPTVLDQRQSKVGSPTAHYINYPGCQRLKLSCSQVTLLANYFPDQIHTNNSLGQQRLTTKLITKIMPKIKIQLWTFFKDVYSLQMRRQIIPQTARRNLADRRFICQHS